jgi:uncharacterized protein involved in exopolysaccharide biosynthesis
MSSAPTIGLTAAPPVAPFALSDLLRVARERRSLIQAITLATVALTLLVLLAIPTTYSTSALVILDQRKNNVADLSAVLSALPTDPASLQNQIQILSSRDLALRVIGKLKLYDDPEFNAALNPGPLQHVQLLLDPRNWSGQPPTQDPAFAQRDAIVTAFLNHLSVDTLGLSTTIGVTFTARDPKKAALIANTISQTYVEDQLNAKRDEARRTTEWLLDRIHRLAQQVQAEEMATQIYKARNNLSEAGDGTSLIEQQLTAINTQLVQARADLAEKQATLDRVKALVQAGDAADVSQILASPLIIQLRTQQSELIRQEAELSTRYGRNHPKMIAIQTQKHDLQEKIAQEVDRLSGSIANDVMVARAQVGSLEASLAQAEKQASGQNMTRVQLKALQANALSTRTMYESFVARLRETQDQDDIQNADARVISQAPVPSSPSSPNRAMLLGASIPAGLLLGLLAALLAERFSSPMPARPQLSRPFVAEPAPAVAAAGPPVLAEIPGAVDERAADFIIDWPQSPFSLMTAGLLRRVLGSARGTKVIALTAPEWGPAKTALAIALARTASRAGLRVAVIDSDLHRPAVARIMGMGQPRVGLLDLLAGRARLSRVLAKDPRSDVLALCAAQPPLDSAAVLASQKMAELVAHLRKTCDLVIIDAAPLLAANDARLVARLCDAVLVVAPAGALRQMPVTEAIGALAAARAGRVGLILTH